MVVRRQWRQKDWRRTALILLIYSLFSSTFRSLFTTTHTATFPNSMFYMSIKCLPFSVILLNDKYGKATKFTVISIQPSTIMRFIWFILLFSMRSVYFVYFGNLAVCAWYRVPCKSTFYECTLCTSTGFSHFHKPHNQNTVYFWGIFFQPLRIDFVITMMETKLKFEINQLKCQQMRLSISLRLHKSTCERTD